MKQKKSTKKFLKSKLKTELEVRKKRKENKFTPKTKAVAEEVPDYSSSEDEENVAGFIDPSINLDGNHSDDSSNDENVEEESDFDEEETIKQMENLKSSDPKFYEFLKENDESLLDMDNDDEEEDIVTGTTAQDQTISKESIKLFIYQIKENSSIKAFQNLLKLFKEAADMNENLSSEFVLIITSTLKHAKTVLDSQLGHDPAQSKKWRKLKQTVKKFLTNILQLLQNTTSASIKKYVLQKSEEIIKYFNNFPKLMKDLIKECVSVFKSESEKLRIVSFLLLRKLSLEFPNPWLDVSFKAMFQAFMESSKNSSVHTWSSLIFMSNCLVEMGGLSLPLTYQHSFVYLRQLAIKLRSCSSGGDYKLVYNWQVYHCCRMWCDLLGAYCGVASDAKDKTILEPLIYPLVQLMIGVIRLKPSSKYFPLRLSLIKLFIKLSEKTKTFIPVTSFVLEMFESSELKQNPKPSTLKPLDFVYNIRAPNQYLGTKTYHKGLVDEAISLLYEYFATQATSIAFPELAIPCVIQLKKMTKQGREFGMTKAIQGLLDKLEQHSKFIEQKRNAVSFGPCDVKASVLFVNEMEFLEGEETPLGKFNVARLKMIERAVPKETMIVDGDSSDDDAEKPIKPKQKKVAKKEKNYELEGDEDLVEDFAFSDDE